ncbi:major tail protein [Enterococcus sp. BWR-S5]|uniref:major tail protein n=1 Tax=Enterococcus sp. BWR-S5 TaxID=2787714 RepID=UPI0019232D3D|nr:major tail protein [Enterococcus sp. BWR-S5]MBL1223734.1 phage tail protein [Enterococcus sp. BWR-S5]
MARQYETREVTHGNAWGAFSKITKTDSGELDTSVAPTVFTGLRAVSLDTTQESNPYYADNQTHVQLRGNKTTEGNITVYQMPKKFVVDHLGYKEIAATGALIDTGKPANFVWQYIETITDEFGTEIEQLTVYYNVSASAPTSESATDEDSVEPKEFEIPVTAQPNNLVVDDEGKAVTFMQIRKTEANAALFDLAYSQIILPDTAIPTP